MPTIPPHRDGTSACERYPGVAGSVSCARKLIDELLGRDHPSREAVRLLTSELIANAVCHTRSNQPDGHIDLSVRVSPERIRVEVCDQGARTHPHVRHPGPHATGGRGLATVDFIADDWGWKADDHGCTVWFEVDHEARWP